jgi:hypothetical protein
LFVASPIQNAPAEKGTRTPVFKLHRPFAPERIATRILRAVLAAKNAVAASRESTRKKAAPQVGLGAGTGILKLEGSRQNVAVPQPLLRVKSPDLTDV